MHNTVKHIWFLLATALTLCLSPYMHAADGDRREEAPQNIHGITRVDAEGLINTYRQNPKMVIIDTRIRSDRVQGYIEGSINLPDMETDCDTLKKFAIERNTPVLFYCNGPKCGRSVTSSTIARDCGYQQIYWFRGGIEEWKRKNFPLIKDIQTR